VSEPVFFHEAAATVEAGDSLDLDGPEGRHAADVRRLRVGEHVLVTDGRGARVAGTVSSVGRGSLSLAVRSASHDQPSTRPLTVVQALPKGERGELAVELLTEVGVDRIVPWQAERCVTRWSGSRADRGRSKWERAAVAAAKQSRRTWWPAVDPAVDTAGVVELLRAADNAWVLHEAADASLTELLDAVPPGPASCALVVGPEGGISVSELAALEGAGAVAARLGPTVLRTSTAGVVGATLTLSRRPAWHRRVEG
jgi:16S rRNA (uracil1498-N3)-methyltransferase